MPHTISKKQIISFAAIAAFFFILGLAISPKSSLLHSSQQYLRSEKSDSLSIEQAPVPVEVEPARMGNLVMQMTATGVTRAVRDVAIIPKLSGEVIELPIHEGQFVSKGALLFKLDNREYQLALAEAQDKLLGAEADYGLQIKERVKNRELQNLSKEFLKENKNLFSDSINSDDSQMRRELAGDIAAILSGEKQNELVAQKTGLSAAALAVRRAELNLSYTEVRAPFSGYVANLKIRQNQQITTGQEVLHLVDLSPIEVELNVLENEIGLVKVGKEVTVTFPAYPNEVFHGQVYAINPVVDSKTKTTKVIVRLIHTKRRILPGMFAYSKIEGRIFKNRLLVPRNAILIRDQRKLLFIVRNGLAKWCYVKTGLENERCVEILDSALGLKAGELVVTKGQYTLVHDQKVVVQKNNEKK